jgi:hypothetical protein
MAGASELHPEETEEVSHRGNGKAREQTERNRANALASTGPQTAEGKRASSRNATRHGILSRLPVLPFEQAEDWNAHREAVLEDCNAEGYVETLFAERVALDFWRLTRVARYEHAKATRRTAYRDAEPWQAECAEILATLDTRPGDELLDQEHGAHVVRLVTTLLSLDPNEDGFPDVEGWPEGLALDECAWTPDSLRAMLDALAEQAGSPLSAALDEARRRFEERAELEKTLDQGKNGLPYAPDLEQVARYETHLERSLVRNLRELQRLQAFRAGVAPPVAVDVSFTAEARS